MATIGLKIAQDPDTASSLSLADTLAKGVFGDPEGQMKARALASEVGVRMASRDKLLADTGLVNIKTKEEQALKDAQDAAAANGPTAANAAANANALPVEAPRPSLDGGGYGPQPGIVDPNVIKMRDAIIAQNNAEWPVIVRSSNGTQLVEAGSKLAGAAALEGGLVPGARVDPNVQRVAGGLYTGSAPTTSTVWSPGDTAGVDAAAREHILEARGTPQKPDVKEFGGAPYLINADGTIAPAQGFQPTPKAPEKQMIGDVLHERQPDGSWKPVAGTAKVEAPKTFQGPDGKMYAEVVDPITGKVTAQPIGGVGPAPVKPLDIGKDTMLPPDPNDPTGTYRTPKTDRPPADPTTPFADSKGDEGIAFNTVLSIANKAASGKVIGPDEARAYATTYNRLFGPKWDQKPDAQGVLRWVVTPGVPPPPGMVLPAPETFLGGQPPATQPPVSPATQPPVAAPPATQPPVSPATQPPVSPVAGGQVFPNDAPKPTPASEAQNKAKQFLPSLQIATQTLDKFNKNNMPTTWALGYTMPSEELGTFGKYVEQYGTSDAAKRFGAAANQWTSASLYDLSGAAIGKGEFDRSVRGMLPRPNDPDDVVATKTKLRHAFLDAVATTAYANDPKVLALLAQGRALNLDASTAGPTTDNAPAGASQGVKDAWSHMSDEAKDRARKRYGQ